MIRWMSLAAWLVSLATLQAQGLTGATARSQATTETAPTGYRGEPVSLDLQGADLRAVLRLFAEVSGLNLVLDRDVEGRVDASVRDVPWDHALDLILRAHGLAYRVDGPIVRIAPVAALAREARERQQLVEIARQGQPLELLTRGLSYARAETVAPLLARTVLSPRGQVETDERTNTLVVSDLPGRLQAVSEVLDVLDRAQPQVEIQARVVQAGQSFARSLGVRWGLVGRATQELGNPWPLTFPSRVGLSGRVGTQGPGAGDPAPDPRAGDLDAVGTAVALPAVAATSALGLTLGAVDGSFDLDVVLSAAEQDGTVRLLSHPRVTTQNNVRAEIIQGDQIPIQTVANNTVVVQFRDAALGLRVTPRITAEDTVIMEIEIDNDFADFARQINGVPPIVTQRASTTVQVGDGETTVIGGIFESERSHAQRRVPGLHRIPLLGWLFRSRDRRESTDELLIFLTPRIVRAPERRP